MLDHDQSIARIAKLHQHLEQLFDVSEMQTGCGFIEDVNRATRCFLREFGRQFDALRFAARERGPGLTEL